LDNFSRKFKHSKKIFSRSRNTNSSISFWWLYGTAVTGATEEYDGTTWATCPGSFKYSKTSLAGSAGTQTAAIRFGGMYHLIQELTEVYDGTSWTSILLVCNSKKSIRRCRNTHQQL
jgi:hypothetical protein